MSATAGNAGGGCGRDREDGEDKFRRRGIELVITYEANFFTPVSRDIAGRREVFLSGRFTLRSIVFLRN